MNDFPLFDYAESIRHRDSGIELAGEQNPVMLLKAREVAEALARGGKEISMDDVMAALMRQGYRSDCLGNAAGGVFKTLDWQWTGRYVKSARIQSHANRLMTWIYIGK